MRLVRRLAETWVVRPATPTRAVIDVTRRCNLRCSMCQTWRRAASTAMTADELGDLFDRLPRLCWLDLTGGEPLLRADFPAIVEHALDRLPALSVLHFQTNGWLGDRAVEVAVAARRRRPEVDLIVTGADRIAANGDVANKVGTYGLSLAAKEHGVPMYVAAPVSTFDLSIPDGSHIPIEDRDPGEVLDIGGKRFAAPGVGARNPAFDVTPAAHLAGLITDRGLIRPVTAERIKEVLG